ncbi:hypothetical protein, partial [Actinomadura rubrisoli]
MSEFSADALGDRTVMVPPPTPSWAPAPAAPAAPGMLPPVDPESTAAWTFDPDEEPDSQGTPAPGFAAAA